MSHSSAPDMKGKLNHLLNRLNCNCNCITCCGETALKTESEPQYRVLTVQFWQAASLSLRSKSCMTLGLRSKSTEVRVRESFVLNFNADFVFLNWLLNFYVTHVLYFPFPHPSLQPLHFCDMSCAIKNFVCCSHTH